MREFLNETRELLVECAKTAGWFLLAAVVSGIAGWMIPSTEYSIFHSNVLWHTKTGLFSIAGLCTLLAIASIAMGIMLPAVFAAFYPLMWVLDRIDTARCWVINKNIRS